MSSVSPASGTAGTQVTFNGSGFGAAQGSGNVWLGSTYGSVVSWSDTQVVASIASGAKSGTAQILQNGVWSDPISFTVVTPVVSSVTPSSGIAGTQVTFNGTGFGATQGSGNVWLGSTYGTVVSWSDTQVVTTVAAGSKSGTAQILQGGVWSDVINFTVVTPVVSSVTPTSGVVGTQVTFAGTGFGATQGSGNVWLGSTYGTVVSWSDTQVVATVAAGAKSGTAQILQGGVWSDVINFTVVTPVVSSVTPTSGVAGTQVTFTGTGFGASQGSGNVWLGSTYGTVVSWSDTQVVATVAAGAKSGTAQILQGGVWSDVINFSVVTPVVSSATPTSGIAGTQVTFTGTGFGATQGSGNVWLGSTYGTVVSWSDTQVVATIASGAKSGTAQILQGGVWSDPISFSVITPVVSSVTPTDGVAGTQVTFTGTGFGATQGSGNVWLGSTYGTVVSWSDTQVVATVAQGATSGTAQILQGGVWSDPINFRIDSSGPLLQFSVADTPLQVNLTSSQNLDWIHWGRVSATLPDRKGGITPLISDYTAVNGALSASSGIIGFSWTDGYNQAAVSETTADVETFAANGGFQITVPADTSVKSLNLYVEVFAGQGQLQASLSDGSAAGIIDQSVIDSNVASKVYSIDFRAGSPNQTLTVTFTSLNGAGGVGLQAATLTQHLPVISIISPAAGQSFAVPGTIQFNATATQFDNPVSDVHATGSDGTVLDSPASPLTANWGPLVAGHYSVTASAADSAGLTNTSTPLELDVIGQGGSLSIQENAPSSPVDLDAQGTGDWVLWGPVNTGDLIIDNPANVLARKSGVAPLISGYKLIGNHRINSLVSAHNLDFTSASQGNFSAFGSEVAVFGLNDGFEITVPADTTPRTLRLYAGEISGDLNVMAFLSDGSAPVATEIGGGGPTGPPSSSATLYTINYSAASSGQTLTVRLTLRSDDGGGQAALIGAALSGPPVPPTIPAPQINSINPDSGPVDIQVTITGTNFGATQGGSQLLFGQMPAQVVSWSDTSVTAIVPAFLSNGSVAQVVIINANGSSNAITFAVPSYRVIPASLKMLVGQAQLLQAADSNGNPIFGLQWTTSNPAIVSLSTDDPPVATAAGAGVATIYAGNVPVPVTVTTAAAGLVSLSVGPQNPQTAIGMTQQFAAIGTYVDGSTQDLTTSAMWNSSPSGVASVSATGQATGLQIGTTTIQATVGNISGSSTLTVQPSLLKFLTVTPAIPGALVGGTQQFMATATYSDGTTQDLTASVTWASSNTSVATVNAGGLATGVGSGQTLITATQGTFAKSVLLNVAANSTPPSISAFTSPDLSSGWSYFDTTVTFLCSAGSASIVTCPGPQTVSSEGTGQVVSGTTADVAGNSASTSVTINLDKTTPGVAIVSPADGSVVTSSSVTVTGSVSVGISGLNGVACGKVSATVSGANFSCDITLHPGVNSVVIAAANQADRRSAVVIHLNLAAPLPAPQSLQITPGTANLLVGATQKFTAVDENGHPRTDVTWTLSDSTVATLMSDSQPTLTALAIGQVTLTANLEAVSTQISVNVLPSLAGGVLPVGTPLWSIPSSGGFSATASVRAEPVDGAPDMYSVEQNANGDINVRALTADGQQLWSTQIPGPTVAIQPVGDAQGGLLLLQEFSTSTRMGQITDLDAQTGETIWESTVLDYNMKTPAIASDGTIYMWGQEGNTFFQIYPPLQQTGKPPVTSLLALDGLTGQLLAQYPIPVDKQTNINGYVTLIANSPVAPPVIDSDGTVWAAFQTQEQDIDTLQQTLSVLKVTPGGEASPLTINTNTASVSSVPNGPSGPFLAHYQIIPNGQGGVLLSWSTNTLGPVTYVYHVSNISDDGGSSDFTVPEWVNNMVLGDNGIAYGANPVDVTAFNINSGAVQWIYRQPSASFDLLAGPVVGGGLVINPPGTGLVTLDSSGGVVSSLGTPVADPFLLGSTAWTGIMNGSFSLFSGPSDLFASSAYPDQKGNDQHQRRSSSCTLTANSDTPLADEAKDNIQRSFLSVHDGGISFVTGTADLYVTNTTFSPPDLPAGTLGLDNVLSNHVKFSSGNIYKAKPKGATGAQALSAGGVVIAHEFGHYLLQCVHFPTDWSPTKVYSLNDLVKYKGQFYSSLIFLNGGPIPNVPDISPKAWALFTLPPTVSDCGNEGIMRPGEMHGDELWHTDFGPGNDFTTNQALAIQKKCRKLHPPRKKP